MKPSHVKADQDQSRLLDAWMRHRTARAGQRAGEADAPRARPVGAPAVASFSQQQMWLLQQAEPDSCAYNVFGAARIEGRLDVAALVQTVDAIVERHEVLRCVYRAGDDPGMPVPQMLAREAWPRLACEDRRGPAETEAHVLQEIEQFGRAPFDLACEPSLRARLYVMADEVAWLALSLHHVAADGASLKLFFDELACGHRAAGHWGVPAWPSLPVTYGDYAAWQRDAVQAGRYDRQRDH